MTNVEPEVTTQGLALDQEKKSQRELVTRGKKEVLLVMELIPLQEDQHLLIKVRELQLMMERRRKVHQGRKLLFLVDSCLCLMFK